MPCSIGIYQKTNSSFSDTVSDALRACGIDVCPCGNGRRHEPCGIALYTADCAALFPDFLDICVLESAHRISNSFPRAERVIMPDICSVAAISQLAPKSVVTYGLSCKNTVTVSSLIKGRMVVSIQREIVSVSGHRTVEQEFSMAAPDCGAVEATLASAALLLMLDVPIDTVKNLSQVFSNTSDIFR